MIHTYTLNGINIVLDVNSGAVHVVDDLTFDIVSELKDSLPDILPAEAKEKLTERYGADAVEEAFSDLKELQKAGQLFSEDTYEMYASAMKAAPIKSMCLNVAHDCNLRCEYCFASKGDFGCGRKLMPYETGKKAIDFMVQNSGTRHHLEVDFFGGEPLMNFDVVKQLVVYARGLEKEYNKEFRFTITTNGLLLNDDSIDFINREMSNAVLSIDGRKEVNDRLRLTPNGSGSYDAIVPKFQKLVASRGPKDYYARGTFTKHNLDFAEDVLHMVDLGFDQLSIEPVVSDVKLPYSIREEDLPAVFKEYERLSNIMIERKKQGRGFNFFHFMIDLNQGPCAIKRLRGCSCGNEYVAVTPEGDIYPCHQFVGEDKWKMGNVVDGTFNNEIKDMFAHTNVYTKPECKHCWAKFYCSGGCNANSWQYEGDVAKPHTIACALEKKRVECAIMIQAALAE